MSLAPWILVSGTEFAERVCPSHILNVTRFELRREAAPAIPDRP